MTTDPRLIECAKAVKATMAERLLATGAVNPSGAEYHLEIARACLIEWRAIELYAASGFQMAIYKTGAESWPHDREDVRARYRAQACAELFGDNGIFLVVHGPVSEHFMNIRGTDLRCERYADGHLENCFVNGHPVSAKTYLKAKKELSE